MKNNNVFIIDFETTGLKIYNKIDFPIEIGIIICDINLNLLDTYTKLIHPDNYIWSKDWSEGQKEAYNIHQISYDEWKLNSKSYNDIKNDIINLSKKYSFTENDKYKKPILMSDNAFFDTTCLRFILPNHLNYFHYATWDTNILLERSVGDPKPKHRALEDCGLLYKQLIKAYSGLF